MLPLFYYLRSTSKRRNNKAKIISLFLRTCRGTKFVNILSTSSSFGYLLNFSNHFFRTDSISVIFLMCTFLCAPIGSRASSIETRIPSLLKTSINATAGAYTPQSTTVPAQSNITPLIVPW